MISSAARSSSALHHPDELLLVRVVEAVGRVAGPGDAQREEHLPPVPRLEALPVGGAKLEHGGLGGDGRWEATREKP